MTSANRSKIKMDVYLNMALSEVLKADSKSGLDSNSRKDKMIEKHTIQDFAE